MYAQGLQKRKRKRLASNRKGTVYRRHGLSGMAFVGFSGIMLLLMLWSVYLIVRVIFGFWKQRTTYNYPLDHTDGGFSTRLQGDAAKFSLEASRRFSESLNQTNPLDDYLTRKHMSLSTPKSRDNDLPILLVGGSDGSGTRYFVNMLGRLGVPMVIDDTGTLDVHAKCMFDGDGWPALVRTILKTTKKANYSWEDFSLVQQAMLQSTLDLFLEVYGKRGHALREQGIQEGFPVSQKVMYGFKAPVSMLTLPLFRHVHGRIKFLHIVRDGRDVSLSKNKSPIQKFYYTFYDNARQRQKQFQSVEGDVIFQEAMSIQLWNDWNVQVLDWEQKHSDGTTFDYLVMRTEDLMDPRTRLTSLRQLADFVGSQKNEWDLCCLSKQKIQDMGKSGISPTDVVVRPPSKWIGPMENFLQYLVHAGRVIFALDSETWNRDREEDSLHRHRTDSSAERLTDGEDLPLQDVLQGIQMERQAVNNGLRQQRPELFRQIDNARQRRFKKMQFGDGSEDLPGSILNVLNGRERQRDVEHRRLYELEERSEGQARGGPFRVPWGNANITKPPKVAVNHTKYDTMVERLKEIEVEHHRDNMLGHVDSAAEFERVRGESLQQEESPELVMKRYGKWRKVVADRPELNRVLLREASEGLRRFGYEPKTRFSDFPVAAECKVPATCRSPPEPN